MKINNKNRFILGKLFAIAMIAIGVHVLRAWMVQTLPFGLISNDMLLLGIWGFTGWLPGLLLVGCGILRFFNKPVKAYIRKLDE